MSVAMAAETTAIADALVIFGAAFASLTGSSVGGVDPLTTIAGAAFLWALGFVVVGIPMMLVTVPCGFLWAVLVRKVARTNAHAAVEP